MENMRVPKFLLQILSRLMSTKLTKEMGVKVNVDCSRLDMSRLGDDTFLGIEVDFKVSNSDVPKVLKKLGIM